MYELVNYVDKEFFRKFLLQKKIDRIKKRDGNIFGWKFRECIYCGGIYEYNKNKCLVFGKICRKCGKFNYFQFVCF